MHSSMRCQPTVVGCAHIMHNNTMGFGGQAKARGLAKHTLTSPHDDIIQEQALCFSSFTYYDNTHYMHCMVDAVRAVYSTKTPDLKQIRLSMKGMFIV